MERYTHDKFVILLVEDNPGDAKLTIMALEEANIANPIVHVKDGEEALDYLYARGKFSNRNVKDLPKLIILDLKMPKVSGIEVLREIKANEATRYIPVVVFTSSMEGPDIKECYELGVNSYIVKPLEFDEFAKVVANLGMYWVLVNQIPD